MADETAEQPAGFLPTCERCNDWLPRDPDLHEKDFKRTVGRAIPDAKYSPTRCPDCNFDKYSGEMWLHNHLKSRGMTVAQYKKGIKK